MCGRYTQLMPWSELVRLYGITDPGPAINLPPRYNVAPTQEVPIVRKTADGGRDLSLVRWGLVPSWAKDVTIGAKMINARAETVEKLPSFRAAFRQRRCLVVADGFYEWRNTGGDRKQPYHIRPAEEEAFAFAGLWERWKTRHGEWLHSFTIIVTSANDFLRPIHDRMPVILPPNRFDDWLNLDLPFERTKALLRPFDGPITAAPVSRRVNSVRVDDEGNVRPAAPPVTGQGRTKIPLPVAIA
jgi:putative SOS response-associated peptidase YedK